MNIVRRSLIVAMFSSAVCFAGIIEIIPSDFDLNNTGLITADGSSASDLYDLDHYRNLEWQINLLVPQNEVIIGAQMSFSNMYDNGIHYWPSEWGTESYHNDLFLGMIDRSEYNPGQDDLVLGSAGKPWGSDDQDGIDEFADIPSYVNLHHYQDIVIGTPNTSTITYTFDEFEVQTLSNYLGDGAFSLTVDPDCHFINDGVTFRIETRAVPEPSTMLMFGTGLFVVAFVLRRRRK